MKKIRVIVCGARGRMGQLLVRAVQEDPSCELVGSIDAGDDLSSVIEHADVVIDFTTAAATASIAKTVAHHKKALVIGTTGHTDAQRAEVLASVRDIPVVFTSNYSTSVNVLFYLARLAANLLSNATVEISETHHVKKLDAPSGTAKMLKQVVESVRGGDVPVRSERVGEVVGDHCVTFSTPDEALTLSHHAIDRAMFARGAVRAGRWVVDQAPGLYDMQDVLQLKK